MRRISRTLVAVAATLALTLTACSKSTPQAPPAPGAAYPVTVGSVTLSQKPTHIISLSATATEMLFAIDAGPQVTAVDETSNYPAARAEDGPVQLQAERRGDRGHASPTWWCSPMTSTTSSTSSRP